MYDALLSFSNTVIRSNGSVKGNNFPGVLKYLQAPRTLNFGNLQNKRQNVDRRQKNGK